MTLPVDLLRNTFTHVVSREPELTTRFYEELFTRYPEARALFPAARRPMQAKMLAEALGAVLDHLEDPSWLSSTLTAMGARHVRYGVQDAMYDWVGECLLVTLERAAGDAWTAEAAKAWADAYGVIAGAMLAGAAEARAAADAAE
ncbi:MAG: globin domain-containing protein [Myxococcota bacterium]